MGDAKEKVSEKWSENEGWLFQKFKTKDNKGVDCSTSELPQHVNQWFNITFEKDKNMISGKGYLAVTFIENNCGKKMNLRFRKFNIPPMIYDGVASNDELCKMQPGRNFLAIKEIKFDNSNVENEKEKSKIEKYKIALAILKESFNENEISETTATCVQGQAQERFYGSDGEISPDGWIIMTYVNDYESFSNLALNKNISVAAMMDKASFQIRVHKTILLRLQSQLKQILSLKFLQDLPMGCEFG